jgi:hypothetical protein
MPPFVGSLEALASTRDTTDEIRSRRKALQRAQTEIRIYTNDPAGNPGVLYRGRVNVLDAAAHEFPMKKNVSSSGSFTVRASHPIAKLIMRIPNDPNECKNVLIRVDKFGGKWRWTGLLHHWTVETRGGVDYLTASFNDDMQFPQFILCPPNPALPLPIWQFPRDYFVFAPAQYGIALTGFINLWRIQGHPFTLPDDPFDLDQYDDAIDLNDWSVHIKCNPFLDFFTDSSLWTVIGSRMNTYDSVIADALDDGQLCMTYRRIFTDEGELVDGLLDNNVANGALVFEVTDRSGFTLPGGTFFNGNPISGLVRSVLTWASGGIEDTLTQVTDDQTLYPDEYWQSSWLASLATAPTRCLRDSQWNDLQSSVTHSPATAVGAVVGGDNPTADAIAQLIIESVGNLVGYFLLGGFDSLGDIAADIIMPFLVGTILAWDESKNFARATKLGWVHLFEIYQQGAENNVWSMAALAAKRGAYTATDDETSHTCVIDESTWFIPGVHGQIGDRISTTSGALERHAGIHMLFVNQIEEMVLQGDDSGASRFLMKVGQNKAAMTQGERSARQLKFALDKLQDIGVRLVA